MIVYLVRNLVNGKIYVGKCKGTIKQRWGVHVWYAEKKIGNYFHSAISKYGPENFSIEEIARASSMEELSELEKFHIARLGSHRPEVGYNLTMGGEGTSPSDELRKRMRDTHLGKKHSPETIEKMRQAKLGKKNPFYGKTHTEEAREKMGDPSRGKKQSPEHVAKRSAALMGRPRTMGFLGKEHSEETKEKLSQAALERFEDLAEVAAVSAEMKQNWSNPKVAKKMLKGLEKARANSPVLQKGHKLSEETKRKISEAAKRRHAAA
jgi:group I intron endonuclease